MRTRPFLLSAALAVGTFAAAACADRSPTAPTPNASMNDNMGHKGAMTGTTPGWSDGSTVTFFYSKNFFCQQPPSSGATSSCELGADAQVAPRPGVMPILYVVVPLGFTPAASTLHCPAGTCIDHPSTIDLSRVFGAGTENATLPAHSHIIGDEGRPVGANGGWWIIKTVGVTSQAAWDQLVAGKSLATLRAVQASGGATGDIPTNLYLFFSVRPK